MDFQYRIPRHLLIWGLVLFSIAGPTFAQGPFMGRIKDIDTGEGIVGATITYGAGKGVVSDINGDFSIEDPTFPLRLQVSHLAYLPKIVTVRGNLETKMIINLEQSKLDIDQVEILGERLNRFFECKFFYVTDYVFIDNKIVIIGYDQGRLNRAKLILTGWQVEGSLVKTLI